MVIMIDLPGGCNPGSAEAIDYFAKEFARLKHRNPDLNFQLVPFSYSKLPGSNQSHLMSIMVITL